MERLWTFIGNMTIWNWLALIAFIFFPLSALNAFFGLKVRYKDWRASQGKKKYRQRLLRYHYELKRIENYLANEKQFFLEVLDQGIRSLLWVVVSITPLSLGLFIHVSP